MLWIEKYRPQSLDGIAGQEQVIRQLRSFARSGTIPHLLLAGPPGTGKSAAMESLARECFGEDWSGNMTVIDAGSLFGLGKAYLEKDDRYAHLYQKNAGLLTNVKQIIRWYASVKPLNAAFRIVGIEAAESLTREAQQALRRIMEQYSRTCRFVYCTTQPAALIPPISSRCLPLFFGALPTEVVLSVLVRIAESEGLAGRFDPDQLDLVVQASSGDLRYAITLFQASVTSDKAFDLAGLSQTEVAQVASAAFTAMKTGDHLGGQKKLESLILEYGLSAGEVLLELRKVVRREYNDPRISVAIADTDAALLTANSEFIQIAALAARVTTGVFG
jgi:replication factor C small subunit